MDSPLPCEIIKEPLKGVNAKKEGALSKLPSVLTAADIFTEAAVIRPYPMVRLTVVKVSRNELAITYS